ncbi:hypothetical protein KY285_031548 [Solanum tuberosum]|nr:hypothetical protein KY284_031334 [Solanum tuberosum]KAH0656666.1 hypothetical protein KY285_031548 [Solanum tuberosum]
MSTPVTSSVLPSIATALLPSSVVNPNPPIINPTPTPTLTPSGSGDNIVSDTSSVVSDPSAPPPTCSVCKLVYTTGYSDCNADINCQFIREKGTVENVVYTTNIESLLQSSYEGNPKKVKHHLRLFLAAVEAKHKGLGMKICKGILRYMGFIVVLFGYGCCC